VIKATETFYWYDYETWGSTPATDRPCQFAGVRTDAALNEIAAPAVLYCRPAEDLLPSPDACLVTGMTPQQAARNGLPETEFARAVQQELSRPGTCSVGYNSLHFDDEVSRHLFYRNLLDPYAHGWRNGNSRWDLIDVLRLAHALRPDGLQWPEHEPGIASFRLEDLTAANGIPHAGAHDALADVRATLALARRLRQVQPRLYNYALTLRDQRRVQELINGGRPLLHVSQRYPASRGCIAPVARVAPHPTNPKAVLCFDLRQDPTQLLELSVDALRTRLFTPAGALPPGLERLPLKGVKVNASPMLAPLKTLDPEAAGRWAIDPAQVDRHAQALVGREAALTAKLKAVFERPDESGVPAAAGDPDLMLYSGFFSDADRRRMQRLHDLSPAELAAEHPRFEDPRLATLLFRMRARSWPETLSEGEREDWDAWRFERLTEPAADSLLGIDAFEQRLAELRAARAADASALALLDALAQWAEQIMDAA
jgi:exodeoxyribonuclease-1